VVVIAIVVLAMAATTLEDLVVVAATGGVVRVTIQCVSLTHNMVRQQRLEVFLTIAGKQERVDARAKFLESEVGGGEEGAAGVGAVEFVEEAGLGEAELEGGEFGGQEGEDAEDVWGWEEDGVDAVDYAVTAELGGVLVHVEVWVSDGRKHLQCRRRRCGSRS